MADQDLVLEFIIKQKGAIDAINSLTDIREQQKLIVNMAKTMATEFDTSISSMVTALKEFNTESINMRANGINVPSLNPMVFNGAEEKAATLDAANRIKQIDQERLETDKAIVANKEQSLNIEKETVALTEKETIAYEKMVQESLKMTPADRAAGAKLEAESRAMLKTENAQILAQDKAMLADKEQQMAIETQLSKDRVVDINQAQELANKEELIRQKKQQQLDASTRLNQVMTQYSSQLSGITRMIPADQSTTLAKLVPQMAQESGLPINTIMRDIQTRFNILPDTIRKATQEIRQFQNGIQGTVKEVLNLNSIMNTAFGVGMAMMIFQLQMLVTKFFTDTIQQAKDLSNAIGKIAIAEQVMSKEGIEVTGKDLLNIVSELEKKFTNISNVDLLKATGDTALRMAGMGITPKELQQLLEAGLAAQIRNPGKTLEEIQGTIVNAALSGNVEGLKTLGIQLSDTQLQKYALQVGIIDKITDKLTDEQKVHARIGFIAQETNKTINETLKLQDNLANSGDKLSANWKNLTQQLAPFVDILNVFVYLAAKFLGFIGQALPVVGGLIDGSVRIGGAFSFLNVVSDNLLKTWKLLYQAGQAILKVYEMFSGQKVSEQPSIANLLKQDTATGSLIPDATNTEDNADKIKKALNDLFEALDTFYDRATNAEEDYQKKSKDDWDDYYDSVFGERTRFLQDWEIDRAKILADAEKEIADKTADANKKKLDAEAKFLEDLRQLREKYLMNLDDALHARDARQILRLAREYAMNKQNLINEYNLRQRSDDTDAQKELADIVNKRDQRLAELDAERALKLKRMDEDFKVKQERTKKEHEIEMQRLEQEKQDRLRQLANTLSEQLKLTDAGSKAVYNTYAAYFGPNGYINRLMDMSFQNTSQYATKLFELLNSISAASIATAGATPMKPISWSYNENVASSISASSLYSSSGSSGYRRAKGGLDIASKPTPLVFGDAGPELALTVPLNQLSNMGGAVSSLFGKSGKGDKMEILLTLSPDLEARVVNKAVGQVEDAIVTVRRNIR